MNCRGPVWVLLVLLTSTVIAYAQGQQCQAPAWAPSKDFNMFTEPQEVALGEVFAARLGASMEVLEDPAITDYLQKLGERVAKQLPPSELKFRFAIIESPDANAMALPGGRVYVTRKMIAYVNSEDELAGVLGHEMGHQISHQGAIEWSRIFRDVVGTRTSDRTRR